MTPEEKTNQRVADAIAYAQSHASGCGKCGRAFWPSTTQQRKRLVPIHDRPGGVCDGSLELTVNLVDGMSDDRPY